MPSLIAEEMRRAYLAQRGVSQGAGITLVSVSQGWMGRLDCAKRVEMIFGNRFMNTSPDWPACYIPNEDMSRALAKLAENFSIALVDTVTDDQGTRFVLIHKVPANANKEVTADEIAPDPNQGLLPIESDNIDDY